MCSIVLEVWITSFHDQNPVQEKNSKLSFLGVSLLEDIYVLSIKQM